MQSRISPFSFKLQTNMRFGPGITSEVIDFAQNNQFKRIALLVDQGVAETGPTRELTARLEAAGLLSRRFVNTFVEPSYDDLESIRAEFQKDSCDALIVVGGGSAIDLAKGISVLLTNDGPAISFRGYGTIKNRGIPLIAIPTTAGSGSEVTPNASFVDLQQKKKLGINTQLYLPVQTYLDPLFTLSCPRSVTVSSGMDALVHTLEAFTAKSTTLLARMYAREAFSLLFDALPAVLNNPGDIEARGEMLIGSYLAGIALINSASGAAGVLSYPLGVHFKVPHGIAGAVFLPAVIQYNIENGYAGYAELYDLMKDIKSDLSTAEKCQEFYRRMVDLIDLAGVPRSLNEFGVTESDLSTLATEAYTNRSKSAEQNPVLTQIPQLTEICRRTFATRRCAVNQ